MNTEKTTQQTEVVNTTNEKSPLVKKDIATVVMPQSQPNTAITVQLQSPPKVNQWSDPLILGPFVAVLAILATSWNALQDRRASVNQARQEQQTESRKVVFTQLIEDLKEVSLMISNLPNEDVKNPSKSKALLNLSTTINKVWLWAEIETVYQIRNHQLRINELYFDALIKSLPLVKNKFDTDELNETLRLTEVQKEEIYKRIIDFKKAYNPIGGRAVENVADEKRLIEKHAELLQTINDLKTKIFDLASCRKIMNNEYTAFMVARQPDTMDQMNLITKLIRQELGVKGDTALLDKQTEGFKMFIKEQSTRAQKETEIIFKS